MKHWYDDEPEEDNEFPPMPDGPPDGIVGAADGSPFEMGADRT